MGDVVDFTDRKSGEIGTLLDKIEGLLGSIDRFSASEVVKSLYEMYRTREEDDPVDFVYKITPFDYSRASEKIRSNINETFEMGFLLTDNSVEGHTTLLYNQQDTDGFPVFIFSITGERI